MRTLFWGKGLHRRGLTRGCAYSAHFHRLKWTLTGGPGQLLLLPRLHSKRR